MAGKLIVFEGVSGAGKTTQINELANWLNTLGIQPVLTCEPGGTKAGQKIKDILLNEDLVNSTQLLLSFADRAQQVAEVIAPAIAQNKLVICDRYTDSSIAYQVYGANNKVQDIYKLINISQAPTPDLTFFLDVPPEVGIARKYSNNRLDDKSIQFHERVYAAYQELAYVNPSVVSIDGTQEIVEINLLIRKWLTTFKLI